MNDCRRIFDLLDEFVDNRLEASERRIVETHLAECDACRAECTEVRAIVQAARGLPRETEPETDLWPGIVARMEAAPRFHRRWRPWLAAAAMLVAVVGAWWAGRWSVAPAEPAPEGNPGAIHVSSGAADDLRRDYQRARAELDTLLAERRGSMSAESLQVVRQNLALIDRAIDDIETALLDNPEDPNLNRSLRLAYDRQLSVLETATRWTLQS